MASPLSACEAAPRKYGTVIDIVYSPDDGGWYAQETDLDAGKSRVTKRIYHSEWAAREAAKPGARHRGRSPWEKWS